MSGNVLDYIAKGVNSNYLGNFAEGLDQAKKRRIMQQQADADTKTAEAALLKAQQPDTQNTPTSILEYTYGLTHPEYAKQQAARPRFVNVPGIGLVELPGSGGGGGGEGGDVPRTVMEAPQPARSAASLTGEQQAQETVDGLKNSLTSMDRAFELADDKKTYAGFGSDTIAAIGSGAPELGGMVGIDKDRAANTKELKSLLVPESLKGMSKFLKPLSEREGELAIKNLADPNYPNRLKRNIIENIRKGMRRELASHEQMVKKWQEEGVRRPGGVPGAAPPPTDGGGDPVAYGQPSQRAIDALKGSPEMQDEFDRKFGPGAAARVLNGG